MATPQEHMIIGLYSPEPQSGKTAVAGILNDLMGFKTRSFASPIKRMVMELMHSAGVDPALRTGYMTRRKEDVIPEIGASFRYLAQTLGTEWGRNQVSYDLWVNVALNNPDLPRFVVFDDVRFPNEYNKLLEAGGQVWMVRRPSARIVTPHTSESLLDAKDFDEVIYNTGSHEDLKSKVHEALLGNL